MNCNLEGIREKAATANARPVNEPTERRESSQHRWAVGIYSNVH